MRILIEDMEMPQNCEECDVKAVCKNYWKLIREQYTRPSWCPLIEVLEPHGRLIDADALINALQELFDMRNKDAEYTGFRGASVSWNDAICYIKDAPTIIPASEEARNDNC